MPNDRASLENLKEIWVCRRHFDCEFVKSQGGSRPSQPPTLFDGIPNSCLKQTTSKSRNTKLTSAEKRRENQDLLDSKRDIIHDFESFQREASVYFKNYSFRNINSDEMTVFKTDDLGRKVISFFHFKNVVSIYGFLKIVLVEKDGIS